jgi:hypothetical protein
LYEPNLVAYQAYGPNIGDLSYMSCASWGTPSLTLNVAAGTTYYFQVGTMYGGDGIAQLNVEPILPPANDNFDQATTISGTSFYESVDVTAATTEAGEPTGNCYYTPQHTVWYKFTAPANGVVNTSLWGSSSGDTILNAYRADGPGLGGLSPSLGCTSYGGSFWFTVQANQTYYFQAGTIWSTSNVLQFSMSFVPAPANDNFADAKLITTLPYDDGADMTAASREDNEPAPTCGYMGRTVWYAYTSTESGSLSQRTDTWWPPTVVAVYTGDSLQSLSEVACRYRYYDSSLLTFHVDAGMTYYFQVGTSDNAWLPFHLEVAPPPVADFSYYPGDPSVFDTVYFNDWSYDPGQVGIQSQAWDFGDGATTSGCCPSHRFAADGDYLVSLTVTTYDGRTASTSRTVSVRTHDVAITKFSVPQAASAGQTRQIVVGVNSRRYVENVRVELYKSVPGPYYNWVWVGALVQRVPVRPANRTTDFKFTYTFTNDDAYVGKVTFKAVAIVEGARDALPADNEAIALPTKVNR